LYFRSSFVFSSRPVFTPSFLSTISSLVIYIFFLHFWYCILLSSFCSTFSRLSPFIYLLCSLSVYIFSIVLIISFSLSFLQISLSFSSFVSLGCS
jgi:hypothetical protein